MCNGSLVLGAEGGQKCALDSPSTHVNAWLAAPNRRNLQAGGVHWHACMHVPRHLHTCSATGVPQYVWSTPDTSGTIPRADGKR